jgi:hypothetical protein
MAAEDLSKYANGVEPPEMWPSTYPPQGEDAELPWLPTDPIPNTEPEAPGLDMPDPALYKA